MISANIYVAVVILLILAGIIIILFGDGNLTGVDVVGMAFAVIIGMMLIWTVLTRGLNK